MALPTLSIVIRVLDSLLSDTSPGFKVEMHARKVVLLSNVFYCVCDPGLTTSRHKLGSFLPVLISFSSENELYVIAIFVSSGLVKISLSSFTYRHFCFRMCEAFSDKPLKRV